MCGSSLEVGNGLESCTYGLETAYLMFDDRTRVEFIDTPGFDDSARSDVEILEVVALALEAM
jgi:hypothetical protein